MPLPPWTAHIRDGHTERRGRSFYSGPVSYATCIVFSSLARPFLGRSCLSTRWTRTLREDLSWLLPSGEGVNSVGTIPMEFEVAAQIIDRKENPAHHLVPRKRRNKSAKAVVS